MEKFGSIRLVRNNVGFFHKMYFRIMGVSPDHKLRFKYFKKALRSHLSYSKVFNVLDVGCGGGDYSYYLAKKMPESNIFSVDIDDNRIRRNCDELKRVGLENISFKCEDISKFASDKKFDLICCVDVLEHIVASRDVLSLLLSCLTENGLLYIHMPLKKERPVFFHEYLKEFHDWEAHEHLSEPFERESFIKLIENKGGEVVFQQTSFNHYLGELCVSIIMMFFKDTNRNKIIKCSLAPLMLLLLHLDIAINNKKGNAIAVLVKNK